MYDVNSTSVPISTLNLFSKVSSVHSYRTRSSTSEHFNTKQTAKNSSKKSIN